MGTWLSWGKAALFAAVVLTGIGGAQGCAAERDPVVRIQPNVVPKSLFLRPDADGRYLSDSDSWFYKWTIIDVPTSQGAAFMGAGSDMPRVKWRISEDGKELQAYREDPDILNSGDPHGGTLATFPIQRHFDIRRQYNAQTGEENNVIEENDVDRPWQQREYMRVDWGTNPVVGSTTWIDDPKDENHPIFQDGYVDFTARLTFRPDFATCFFVYRDFGCGNADVSARFSFMKVPARDYVARDYPDRIPLVDNDGNPIRTVSGNVIGLPMMDEFGFFRTERAQYDQRMGTLEKRFLYRANIWNIWDQWFARDKDGNILKHENGQNVLLPYRERKIRPIVYFLNKEWPASMKPIAQGAADAWNETFMETVASLRILDFHEENGLPMAVPFGELRAEVDAMKARGERVFVLCQNEVVQAGDHPACGEVGTHARQGDLRYSFMYWVHKPQPSGPLGFGPSYADPITGEIFNAMSYVYGAALDTYAQNGTDIVNLLNGRSKEFDFANGINTDEYAKRLAAGDVPGPGQNGMIGFSQSTPGQPGFNLAQAQLNVDRGIDRGMLKTIATKGLPLATGPTGKQRLEQIFQKPQLAQKILENPETRLLAGFAPDRSIEEQLRDRGVAQSDVGKQNDLALHAITDALFSTDTKKENERLRFLGEHGCFLEAEMIDDSVVGLARQMAAKYSGTGTPKEQETQNLAMWDEIRGHILRGLLEHEVGHTVGLRHNFEGSSDATNFFDEFWSLKQESLSFGAPMTENQKNGRISEFQYSTVMDYGSRFNSDIRSLGKYDYAAIRFGYGNLVESFKAQSIKEPLYRATPQRFGNGFFTGYAPEVLDDINRHYRHYTQIPGEFTDGIGSLRRDAREIRRFDDVVANAREKYIQANGNPNLVKTTSDNGGIDVVPYRYCGDEFAGSANRPLCQRWDQGMDSFEVVSDAISRYRQYYIFDAFTRGRANGFSMFRSYLGKIATRYFSHVHQQYIHWLFYQGTYDYYWRAILGGVSGVRSGFIGNEDWFKDPAGGLPSTLATTWGLDRLIDVLGTPDIGVYANNTDHPLYADNTFFEQVTSSPYACRNDQGATVKCGSFANQLTLDIDQGARYRFTRYDNSSGQGFFNRIKNMGSFYDKIAALMMLTNTETNFVGQDQTNAVSYRIGFYLAYPRAMSSIFGGITSDTFDNYSWRYDYSGDQVRLMTPNVFESLGSQDGRPAPGALAGKALDSGWYFYYKAYALFFSMAEFQANFSQSWNDTVRIWCVGCGESFTPGPGTTPVIATDPLSGKQYGALDYADGRYSPATDLIRQTQKLIDAFNVANTLPADAPDRTFQVNRARARLQDQVELMDLIRGLYDVYGYTRF